MKRNRSIKFQKNYDIAVIGGGIYGACLAWEASHRGARTLLVERGDFASSVSANSMKTIHGGVRYLQSLDFARMWSSSQERKTLMRIAPHLVEPLGCMLPTTKKLTRSRLSVWGGMTLYNLVTWNRNKGMDQAHQLPPAKVVNKPAFERAFNSVAVNQKAASKITGSAIWYDAQAVNTERLVLEFVLAAAEHKADVANHTELLHFHKSQQTSDYTLTLKDHLTDEQTITNAKVVIDARGFWRFLGHQAPTTDFVKAVNLVVDGRFSDYAMGLNATTQQGDRLLFLAPWGDQTIIGTWYFDHELKDQLALSPEELKVCLKQMDSLFENYQFKKESIRKVHIGLLPGKHGLLDPAAGLWDRPQITQEDQYFSVQGVKYTTARDVAQTVLDKIAAQGMLKLKPSESSNQPLPGARYESHQKLQNELHEQFGFSEDQADGLISRYGSRALEVANRIKADGYQAVHHLSGYYYAEIDFCVRYEFVETLADLLIRRFGVGARGVVDRRTVHFCAERMARICSWSDVMFFKQIKDYYSHYPDWLKEMKHDVKSV